MLVSSNHCLENVQFWIPFKGIFCLYVSFVGWKASLSIFFLLFLMRINLKHNIWILNVLHRGLDSSDVYNLFR